MGICENISRIQITSRIRLIVYCSKAGPRPLSKKFRRHSSAAFSVKAQKGYSRTIQSSGTVEFNVTLNTVYTGHFGDDLLSPNCLTCAKKMLLLTIHSAATRKTNNYNHVTTTIGGNY